MFERIIKCLTSRGQRSVSYYFLQHTSGDDRFESQPGQKLFRLSLRAFFQSLQTNAVIGPLIIPGRFFTYPFQFIIHILNSSLRVPDVGEEILSFLLFWQRSRVQNSIRRPSIVIYIYIYISSVHPRTCRGSLSQIRLRSVPSTSLPICYSLIILFFIT